MNRRAYFFLPFLIFSFLGILTLSHYGVSWDEPEHFLRGQGYLRLFLTGKTTYGGVPKYDLARARSEPGYHERSYYQNDSYGAETWFIDDKGHPPLNDILASLTNVIFYQKLGLLGDIESYHFFNVLISAVLVGIVFLFAAETFGIWTAVFASLFLSTYPLFWAESHFNIKDPAQTTFFVLSLYFFWRAFVTAKRKFVFLSSLFAGFALSVKFNVVFLPFILIPWLASVFLAQAEETYEFVFTKKTLLIFFAFPFLMLAVLFAVWPFLWQDPLGNLHSVLKYYRELGTEDKVPLSLFAGWNIYAGRWILYTTPPLTLFAFLVGLLAIGKAWSEKKNVVILWLLLFLVPIIRVSIPGASIYGGVRQIMEYIPGMALLAGVGAEQMVKWLHGYMVKWFPKLSNHLAIKLFIVLVFVYPVFILAKLHPNQNVYFNFLTGGLRGAVTNRIPAAGNSYGNAYFQGVKWLNENAPSNSTLALIQGTSLNIPVVELRGDIDFSNDYWSGIERRGEYLMELTYNEEFRTYFYAWEYVEKMLDPVYQVTSDGVPLLAIWKNDLEHTKPEYKKTESVYKGARDVAVDGKTVTITVPKKVILSRLVINYVPTQGCGLFKEGYIETSADGETWIQEKDPVALEQFPSGGFVKEKQGKKIFQYPFAAREIKFIRVVSHNPGACILNSNDMDLVILQ